MNNVPLQVISGGQTGIDRAALDAAMAVGLPVGGWCPKNKKAEDGRVPEKYPLVECRSYDYKERTQLNVGCAHATLIVYRNTITSGTLQTTQYARKYKKQLSVNQLPLNAYQKKLMVLQIRIWLVLHRLSAGGTFVLNVAGPRESRRPGVYAEAYELLRDVFEQVTLSSEYQRAVTHGTRPS